MILPVDDELREEARRFGLVFTCPRCAQFDPEGERCTLGYPTEPHRSVDLDVATEVVFCKAFELA